jgi:predicted esterase
MRAVQSGVVSCILFLIIPAEAAAADWSGRWFTSEGVMTLEQDGAKVTGSYGKDAAFAIEGKASGDTVKFDYTAGNVKGEGEFRMSGDGLAFTGSWKRARGSGNWYGCRHDKEAEKAKRADVAGHWRTSWGLMELRQKGNRLEGEYGAQGFGSVQGGIKGRRLTLDYRWLQWTGKIVVDVSPDGDSLYGAGGSDDGKFIGRRLSGYEADPTPKAGETVAAIAKNRLTCYLHAPKGWRKGKEVPAIVFFHGSNMSTKPYVGTLAEAFGDRYMIVGIDGEGWEDWSKPDDPRHNYRYINWMGKSTYKGYPNTHRESPALVAETIEDLKERLKLTKVFVGGHSQGAFLTYFLVTHFPELIDGAFPVSGGVVIQCEPDVFEDEKLLAAQREVPLAVVHGMKDPSVNYSQGLDSYQRFLDYGFPMVRMFGNDAGHGFVFLEWQEAIRWMEALSSDDPAVLIRFAGERQKEKGWRDVVAACRRARGLKLDKLEKAAVGKLEEAIRRAASRDAEKFTKLISENRNGRWMDDFLEFRAGFEFAEIVKPAMDLYSKLRAEHEAPAKQLFGEARAAFRSGDREKGSAKYEEILEKHYASSLYRRVKRLHGEK